MQAITPFLWFENQAEEAANFYVSIFKDGKIGEGNKYDENGANATGRPKGSTMVVEFELKGQKFIALNGGPQYKFTEAVSFVVNCEDQEEVDYYWEKLSEGGQKSRCGWLKDKYGLSWQVVPTALPRLMSKDPSRSQKVMQAMLQMDKLDIATLEKAYDQP